MNILSDKDMKTLADKVRSRQKFIGVIIPWIEKLVSKHGEELSYSQGSCHTHIVAELKNFNGFSFKTDTGHSMMGGNSFKIWYHPGKKLDNGGTLVLDLYFQVHVGESQVRSFDTSTKWVEKLLLAKKGAVAILRQRTALAKDNLNRLTVKEKRVVLEKRLVEIAKDLGF